MAGEGDNGSREGPLARDTSPKKALPKPHTLNNSTQHLHPKPQPKHHQPSKNSQHHSSSITYTSLHFQIFKLPHFQITLIFKLPHFQNCPHFQPLPFFQLIPPHPAIPLITQN